MTEYDDFNNIPWGRYGLIMADPAWKWKTRSEKGLLGRPQHYKRMTLKDIKAMPVADVAAKDCWLFLWTTGPMLEQTFGVIKAWGFKYSGMGFTWLKLNKSFNGDSFTEKDVFMGGGYTTRKNQEFCLLARKGSPKRLRKDIREPIISPVREHSRKPDEAYDRAKLFADGPYLEMNSRETRTGWDVFGDEIGKLDKKPEFELVGNSACP